MEWKQWKQGVGGAVNIIIFFFSCVVRWILHRLAFATDLEGRKGLKMLEEKGTYFGFFQRRYCEDNFGEFVKDPFPIVKH